MHKAVLVIVAVVAPIFCECLMQEALADGSPSLATAKRPVKSVGTFSVVPMPHVACIAGSRVPIQLHVIRSTFLIDNLDPMSRMAVSRIGGALPKAAGFIGGRAGPLTDVVLAELS